MATKKSVSVEPATQVKEVETVEEINEMTRVRVVSGNLAWETGICVRKMGNIAYVEIDSELRTDIAYKIPVSSLANVKESV